MRNLRFLFLLTCLLPLSLFAADNEKHFNKGHFTPYPSLQVNGNEGVAAAFAGRSDHFVIVAGGCNFPETPAAEGGQKKFYDDIWVLELDKDRGYYIKRAYANWKQVGSLPRPIAYGASVSVADGVVCLGGTSDGQTSLNEVCLLSFKNGKLAIKPLPPLPVGLDQMAAAYGNGNIYVLGGQSNGKPNTHVYSLAYDENATAWTEIDVPAETANTLAALQPCAIVQNGSVGMELYFFGGYYPDRKVANTTACSYTPNRREPWQQLKPTDFALVGASAVTCGASNILFFGGVNRQVFEAAIQHPRPDYLTHPAEWYQFRDSILVYNTVTHAWSTHFPSKRIARAGASVVPGFTNNSWIVIDGEEKPGIRSADVTSVEISYTAHFGWINWTVLVLYLIGMLWLGYYFMKQEGNADDFFKGGNRIPWWAAGISIFATMLSAITYMSIPAKAFMTDWTYYPMQVCILLVSFPVIKYFLPFFRRLNITTAYEYLEHRFNYPIRLMASILFIVFMVARMALVLFLPSLAMTAVTGINIYLCIVIMAIVTIIYCTMGGVEAVVWGDVVQGIILVGGAILAAAYLMTNTGNGASDFFQIAWDNDKFRLFDWSFDYRTATFWVVILGGIANNLISYTSDQTVIQRYLTTKDEQSAARSIMTNGLMSVFVTIAFFTIGTGLYTFYQTHPVAMDLTMQKNDAIFPFFMMSQLPTGLAGLLIAAVFAATMSTISSNINSISTAFTVDIYKKARPHVSDRGTLLTARVTGIISGLIGMFIAILMATVNIQSLLDYFNTILGLLSGGIGGLFIMGIFFSHISSRAAFAGFLVGTATVFWMNFCTPANFLLFGFVSMAVSVIVALLCSLVWKERRPLKGFTWKTLGRPAQSEQG